MRILLAIIALAAAACTAPADQPAAGQAFIGIDNRPLVTASGEIDASVQEALTADPAACTKAGGELKPVCRMQRPMCLIKFSDAGETCDDATDCDSGRCFAQDGAVAGQAAQGQCAPSNDPCGCYQTIKAGLAEPGLCVD